MRGISRNLRNSGVAFAVALSVVTGGVTVAPAPAYAIYCSNCSTFYQQLLEYAEAVNNQINTAQQLTQQINMYKDMVRQGMSLDGTVFSSLMTDMRRLQSVYQEGRSLAHSMTNLDSAFREQFKGYDDYLRSAGKASEMMPDRYTKWAEQGFDNARTAMKAAGMQTSAIAGEEDVLRQLVNRSSTAAGRMQAIQAGNEIAAQQVQQLQRLREMIAANITLQGNYMAQQTERQAVDDAFREKFRSVPVQNTGRDKGY